MKRIASLDFLRGFAAFSVAIPHYLSLNSSNSPVAEAVAVTAVEVFFVLSGFVLAPQIIGMVLGKPAQHLQVFLIRRWMRTIPPYLVALILVSIITGQLLSLDFLRYFVYVQNLFSQSNANDYFPIAWSLAVEEWFYVSFAPLLFILARLFRRTDRKFAAIFCICFILAFSTIRVFADYAHWDAAVRRVSIFRVDSIAWGFLLYLVLEKIALLNFATRRGRSYFCLSLALFVACTCVGAATAYLTTTENLLSKQAFPFAAAAVGISAVLFFRLAKSVFEGKIVSWFSFYLGGISYSVYLFHIVLVMVLKPKLSGLSLTLQLVIYLASLFLLSSVFWAYFEKPILAARPRYGVQDRPGRQPPSPSDEALRAAEIS